MTCNCRVASPAVIPAATAAAMPLRPPVLGTTTLLTFFIMLPLSTASTRCGSSGSSLRTNAAQ